MKLIERESEIDVKKKKITKNEFSRNYHFHFSGVQIVQQLEMLARRVCAPDTPLLDSNDKGE